MKVCWVLVLIALLAAAVGVSADSAPHDFDIAQTEDEAEAEVQAFDETETDADAEAEVDAETESESVDEAEAESESEAEDEAEVEEADVDRFREALGTAETEMSLESISSGADLSMQFEDESSDEAAEDAEDAQATAEEQAFAATSRFQEQTRAVHYNEQFAKEATVYAQGAYFTTDPEKCIHKLGHSDFELQHSVTERIFDGSSLFAFTGIDNPKKRMVIAFTGDVAMSSLARRLWKGKPIKYKTLCKSCKTHKYFALLNSKICPEVIASVRLLVKEHPDYEVVITGHGMGGALAAMCGYHLEMARVFKHSNKRRFITYGQPRVGNCHWARKFNQIFPRAIRVTHGNDPVVHIAPCHADPSTQRCIEVKDRKKRLWGYHFPTQVWYPGGMPKWNSTADASGSFTVCQGSNWGEDEACRNHPLGFSMPNHRHYFGVDIANNCNAVLGTL